MLYMKKRLVYALAVLLVFLFSACSLREKKEDEMYVYYLNADGNALIQEIYPKMNVKNALETLYAHDILKGDTKPEGYELKGTCLNLYFKKTYLNLTKGMEVLTRAAVVKTLNQIDGVDFVQFYVDGSALSDSGGRPIGMMRADDFIQSTGSSIDSYQTTGLTLYFADKDGKGLKPVRKEGVRYNANTSMERLVMEQLMKGTDKSGTQATIPASTVLLGVSVRDGVCYINFDSKFVSDSYMLSPEVPIYSVVDSLIANGGVSKVQILIDGANDVNYKGMVDLSKPLEWNAAIINNEK